MASSPRLAKSAAIIGSLGRPKSILIDGEEFPFHIAEEISASGNAASGFRELSVTIFIDGPVSFHDEEALN